MSLPRVATVWILLLALAASPLASTVKAAEDLPLLPGSTRAPSAPLILSPTTTALLDGEVASDPAWQSWSAAAASSAAVQGGPYRGGRYGGGRRGRSAAAEALIFGAAAAITGAAILAYANRPDCDHDGQMSGCGYGTKVVGTSVLAGGLVGVAVGAALWR